MISSISSQGSFFPYPPSREKPLSPVQEAEKARIEARLEQLEKKMAEEDRSGLDSSEVDQKERLKDRDAEVRAHEREHLAAAGGLASGGMSLVYQVGPDGQSYAVGGSVKIDTSKGRTPEETIQRAQSIRAAALAPSKPSSADMKVAARASQMEAEARAEMADRRQEAVEEATGAAPIKQASPHAPEALSGTLAVASVNAFQSRVAELYRSSSNRWGSENGWTVNAVA